MAEITPEIELDDPTDENEIEVSVEISEAPKTTEHRFSVVILDRNYDHQLTKSDNQRTNINDDSNFHEIPLKENGQQHGQIENRKSATTIDDSAKDNEMARWKDNIVMSKIRCAYINLSAWGCLHVPARLVNILVLSRSEVSPNAAKIISTILISILLYVNVWSLFHLRRTVLHKWFKSSLVISWVTSLLSFIYIIVTFFEVTSTGDWAFFKIFSLGLLICSTIGIWITSIVSVVHLTVAALRKTSQPHQPVPTQDPTTENTEEEPGPEARYRGFDTRTAFRCSVALAVSCCLSLPVCVALSVRSCSIIWLFGFSMMVVILPLIVCGIKIHKQEDKSEFLWLSIIWVSVLALVVVILTFVVTIIDFKSCNYSKTAGNIILDLFLLLFSIANAAILTKMLWTGTYPLRSKDAQHDDVTDAEPEEREAVNTDSVNIDSATSKLPADNSATEVHP